MRIKDSTVRIRGMSPELLFAIVQIEAAARSLNRDYEPTITSCIDGPHSWASLHYRGDAVDIRTRDLPPGMDVAILAEAIRDRLTHREYDVVVEKDHIHVEFQPKIEG